jgi:hypothetical protein
VLLFSGLIAVCRIEISSTLSAVELEMIGVIKDAKNNAIKANALPLTIVFINTS